MEKIARQRSTKVANETTNKLSGAAEDMALKKKNTNVYTTIKPTSIYFLNLYLWIEVTQ